MNTITQTEREYLRCDNSFSYCGEHAETVRNLVRHLLDTLESAEAAVKCAESRHLEDRHTLQALASEHAARAYELERQRDRLAEKATYACNHDCPFDECCPFPSGDCEKITALDWLEWSANRE